MPESGIGRTRSASAGASRGELLAHPHARGVHLDALEPRVRAREVEELEDAERAGRAVDRLLRDSTPDSSTTTQLAGRDLALELGADQVERARLRGDDPAVVQAAEDERPEAVRIAEREQLALGERGHGVRALEPAHRVDDRVGERRRVVRDQRGDQLGVGARREPRVERRRAARTR